MSSNDPNKVEHDVDPRTVVSSNRTVAGFVPAALYSTYQASVLLVVAVPL
jgi:hypothetical protein